MNFVCALSIFRDAKLVDCYSESTSATLEITGSTATISINLAPLEGAKCDFPPGVMLQLSFTDPSLQVAELVTDFNFETTKQVNLTIGANAENYDQVSYIKFRIDSPELATEMAVGAVVNSRLNEASCETQSIMQATGNVISLIVQEPCEKLENMLVDTFKTTSLLYSGEYVSSVIDCGNQNLMVGDVFMKTFVDDEYFGNIRYESAADTVYYITGTIDGIYNTITVRPMGLVFSNSIKYIEMFSAEMYGSYLTIHIVKDADYDSDLLPKLANSTYTEVQMAIIFTYYVSPMVVAQLHFVVSNELLMTGEGRLSCEDATDVLQCEEVFVRFSGFHPAALYIVPIVQYYGELDIEMVESFFVLQKSVSCYMNATIFASPRMLTVTLTQRPMLSGCNFTDNESVEATLINYVDKDAYVVDDGAELLSTKIGEYNCSQLQVKFAIQYEQFRKMIDIQKNNHAMLLRLKSSDFTEEVKILDFEYSDDRKVATLDVALLIGFTLFLIAVSIVSIVVQKYGKCKGKHGQKRAEIVDDM